ncbi:hypothetical protein JCM10213_007901 [Rhodosporidiobolus nylandii]
MTRNQAGIDFDRHPPRVHNGRDATRVYATDQEVVSNPNESDEHKQAAADEMRSFEEAERRTADGYKGTVYEPLAPAKTKRDYAGKIGDLPKWTEEVKSERPGEVASEGLKGGLDRLTGGKWPA